MAPAQPSQVVAITGGGSGIGAATARRMAANGWRVAIIGRRLGPLEAVARETDGLAIAGDMSDEQEVRQVFDQLLSSYGRLDGLVLSPGVILPGRVADLSPADWHATIATNLTGAFLVLRAALPRLVETRGAVVAIGSIGADRTGPGSAAYGASKAGLVRLIRSVAVDYAAHGIRANTVNPGWVRSEMADAEMDALGRERGLSREAAYELVTEHVPAGRPASADEVAAAVGWLLSADASYVNGAVLTVDGGTSTVGVGTLAFSRAPARDTHEN